MHGYLVVLKSDSKDATWIPGYRGIDRTIPYSLDAAKRGFVDPLIFSSSNVINEVGLIRTLDDAEQVARIFSQTEPPDDLEIIRVHKAPRDRELLTIPSGWCSLGFDVAGSSAPFYSLVGDFPSDNELDWHRRQLNHHGLFSDLETAMDYLTMYQQLELADYDLPYTYWAIFVRHHG